MSFSCSQCMNAGVMFAFVKEEKCGNDKVPGPFVFRCGCSYGRADRRSALPLWTEHDAKTYTPEHSGGMPQIKAKAIAEPKPERPATVKITESPRANAELAFFDDDDDLF